MPGTITGPAGALGGQLRAADRPACGSAGSRGRLDRACRQMEAIFLEYMLSQMRKTVGRGGIIGRSSAMRLYQGLYDQQLSRELSCRKSLGLAEMIKQQLLQHRPVGGPKAENNAKVSTGDADMANGGPVRFNSGRSPE